MGPYMALYGFFSRGPKSLAPPLVVVATTLSLHHDYVLKVEVLDVCAVVPPVLPGAGGPGDARPAAQRQRHGVDGALLGEVEGDLTRQLLPAVVRDASVRRVEVNAEVLDGLPEHGDNACSIRRPK